MTGRLMRGLSRLLSPPGRGRLDDSGSLGVDAVVASALLAAAATLAVAGMAAFWRVLALNAAEYAPVQTEAMMELAAARIRPERVCVSPARDLPSPLPAAGTYIPEVRADMCRVAGDPLWGVGATRSAFAAEADGMVRWFGEPHIAPVNWWIPDPSASTPPAACSVSQTADCLLRVAFTDSTAAAAASANRRWVMHGEPPIGPCFTTRDDHSDSGLARSRVECWDYYLGAGELWLNVYEPHTPGGPVGAGNPALPAATPPLAAADPEAGLNTRGAGVVWVRSSEESYRLAAGVVDGAWSCGPVRNFETGGGLAPQDPSAARSLMLNTPTAHMMRAGGCDDYRSIAGQVYCGVRRPDAAEPVWQPDAEDARGWRCLRTAGGPARLVDGDGIRLGAGGAPLGARDPDGAPVTVAGETQPSLPARFDPARFGPVLFRGCWLRGADLARFLRSDHGNATPEYRPANYRLVDADSNPATPGVWLYDPSDSPCAAEEVSVSSPGSPDADDYKLSAYAEIVISTRH